MDDAKLFMTMKMAGTANEKFNTSLPDCIEVVHMLITNRCCVAVIGGWIEAHLPCMIGTLYECYVRGIDAVQISAISERTCFRNMFLTLCNEKKSQ